MELTQVLSPRYMPSSSVSDSLPPATLGFQDSAPGFCLTLWASSHGHVSDRSLFSTLCIVPTPQAVSANWDWEWKQVWEERERKQSFHVGVHKTFHILSVFTTKTHITTIATGCRKSQYSQHLFVMGQTPPQARLTPAPILHTPTAMPSHIAFQYRILFYTTAICEIIRTKITLRIAFEHSETLMV